MRVGNVALNTFDAELAAERAAAAVFDHVAELIDRGGLTHDAVIQLFTARLELVAHHQRAVFGRAFFIAGDEKGDGQSRLRVCSKKLFSRHHHGGNRAFHVGCAATVKQAIAVAGRKRWRGPLRQRAGGHHVGVAGKHQRGRGCASRAGELGPQVGDPKVVGAADDGLADKAQWRQTRCDQRLATRVFGCERSA